MTKRQSGNIQYITQTDFTHQDNMIIPVDDITATPDCSRGIELALSSHKYTTQQNG